MIVEICETVKLYEDDCGEINGSEDIQHVEDKWRFVRQGLENMRMVENRISNMLTIVMQRI